MALSAQGIISTLHTLPDGEVRVAPVVRESTAITGEIWHITHVIKQNVGVHLGMVQLVFSTRPTFVA